MHSVITANEVTPKMVTDELLATLASIQGSDMGPEDKIIAIDAAEGDARELHRLIRERDRERHIQCAQPRRMFTHSTHTFG